MKILLTNDDGIDSIGLHALIDVLKDEYELYVCAPSEQRSGYSHSVTYFTRINRAWKKEIAGTKGAWAVEGTPADCVYYSCNAFMEEAPDLVISGINLGPNLATDCIYSGTVGAAEEALVHRLPSMAVSLASFDSEDCSAAAAFVHNMIPVYMKDENRNDFILNINVPEGDIKGIKVVPLENGRDYTKDVHITDVEGTMYLKCAAKPIDIRSTVTGDVTAVEEGYISVSPLMHDMTLHPVLKDMQAYGEASLLEDGK